MIILIFFFIFEKYEQTPKSHDNWVFSLHKNFNSERDSEPLAIQEKPRSRHFIKTVNIFNLTSKN